MDFLRRYPKPNAKLAWFGLVWGLWTWFGSGYLGDWRGEIGEVDYWMRGTLIFDI